MATRSQKIKLGVFLSAALALLIVTVAVLTGVGLWQDREPYFIEFRESVAGLEEGAPVSLRGVRVGTVEAIRVKPDNSEVVEVRIRVEEDAPIKTDTQAFINMQGLTGLKFVELGRGSEEAPKLPPGGEIQAGRSMMEQLTGQATDIGLKVEQVLNNVLYLTREENQQRFDRIIANAEEGSRELSEMSDELSVTLQAARGFVEDNRQPVTEFIANANRTSASADEVLEEILNLTRLAQTVLDRAEIPTAVSEVRQTNSMLQERLDSMQMNEMMDKVTIALDQLTVLLDDLASTVDQNQDQLRATIRNMRMAAESFKELARSLQAKPSRLFFDDEPQERELP